MAVVQSNCLQELEKNLIRYLEKEPSSIDFDKRKQGIQKVFNELDETEAAIMERYIRINQENGISVSFMAESYFFFLSENDKEEMYFYRNGQYRYSKLDEVINQVYNDENYMRRYMAGVAVSLLLWPQHRSYLRFYRHFMKTYKRDKGIYLEVGAGHGIYCSEALKQGRFDRYDVVDISETSLALTKKMTAEFIDTHEIRFIHADFLQFESEERYDVISISEVLEHVETPQEFLDKSRKLMKDDGCLYLTTCINAPEIDHIYLFRTIQEVEDLFASAGLGIDEKLYVPYKNTTIERSERQKLPINVAYILKKI